MILNRPLKLEGERLHGGHKNAQGELPVKPGKKPRKGNAEWGSAVLSYSRYANVI